jgi:site-specific DNA recombinase
MERTVIPNGNPNRIALNYSRRSKEGGRSVERQEQDGLKRATELGCGSAELYSEWVSASQFSQKSRKEWLALIQRIEGLAEDIRSGREYVVLLWMEDRSARYYAEAGEFIKECKRVGLTRIVLPSDEYDFNDPEHEAKFMGEVLQAQREVAKMSRRSRAAKLESAENGERHYGGSREFGDRGKRRVVDGDGNWRVVPIVSFEQALTEQQWIQEATDRFLAGDSLRGIRLNWTARGIRTTTGKPFTNQSLRKLLLSPRLVGKRVHRIYREQNGKQVLVSETLYDSNDYAIIVEYEKWLAVKELLTDESRTTNLRGGTAKHELSGLLLCGICKHRMYTKWRGGKVLYRCVPDPSKGSCGKVSRLAEGVEWLVEQALFLAVEENPAYDEATKGLDGDDPTRPILERLAVNRARLDGLKAKEDAALELELDGKEDEARRLTATIERLRTKYESDSDRDRQELARLRGQQVQERIPRNLRKVWPSLSIDRRRAILRAVFDGMGKVIELHPTNSGRRTLDPDAVKIVPQTPVSQSDSATQDQ